MLQYQLGTLEASEALIKDLYINLRAKVNAWSEITQQTPQARMGYIGQHLVSIVTGYPGGKSGARGYDLVIGREHYGEIKTCYRVDQLGMCSDCNAVVSSLETSCSACGSTNIVRKSDSKWLIDIRNEDEFAKILNPLFYYFVLFELEDISDPSRNDIIASIWAVDPKAKGFAYCMIDYYLNIRAKSLSRAPFNMWPHNLKFLITKPQLIYQSRITGGGEIRTDIFPSLGNARPEELKPLPDYSRATTLTADIVQRVLRRIDPANAASGSNKRVLLNRLEGLRRGNSLNNSNLCDAFADEIYLPRIRPQADKIPDPIKAFYPDLA